MNEICTISRLTYSSEIAIFRERINEKSEFFSLPSYFFVKLAFLPEPEDEPEELEEDLDEPEDLLDEEDTAFPFSSTFNF